MRRTPVLVLLVLPLGAADPGPGPVRHARGGVAGPGQRGFRRAGRHRRPQALPGVPRRRAVPPSCWWPATARPAATGRDDLLHPDAPRTMVLPGVAEFTRVCAYDRPGTYATIGEDVLVSRSDAIAQPRTAPEMVAELHALLQAAEIPGPYVLAATRWGGFIARLYASHLPRRGRSASSSSTPTPSCWRRDAARSAGRRWCGSTRRSGSDKVFPIPGYGDAETIDYGADNAVVREAVAASPLPPMPLAVLAHGRPFARCRKIARRGSPPGSWKRYLLAANTKRWPPWSRTRASPWPARAATTSTRINRSW